MWMNLLLLLLLLLSAFLTTLFSLLLLLRVLMIQQLSLINFNSYFFIQFFKFVCVCVWVWIDKFILKFNEEIFHLNIDISTPSTRIESNLRVRAWVRFLCVNDIIKYKKLSWICLLLIFVCLFQKLFKPLSKQNTFQMGWFLQILIIFNTNNNNNLNCSLGFPYTLSLSHKLHLVRHRFGGDFIDIEILIQCHRYRQR